MKKLSLFLAAITVITTLVLALLYSTHLGDKYFRTQETVFYQNIKRNARITSTYSKEISKGADTARYSGENYIDAEGTFKFSGKLECQIEHPELGAVRSSIEMITIDQSNYFKLTNLSASAFEGEERELFNESIAGALNTWVESDEQNLAYRSLKDSDVLIAYDGIRSTGLSQDLIATTLKENGVFAIVKTEALGTGSDRTYKYTVRVDKEKYKNTVEELTPDLRNKDAIFDQLFGDKDFYEYEQVVGVTSSATISSTHEVANGCADFAESINPDVQDQVPKTLQINSEQTGENSSLKLTKPDETISEEEFTSLLAGEI